ncbi:helix-turn-helix domain-containing protein [Sporosarcina sp. FSL K6-1508]|uniref:helix-turn-helix domain-containing protein n=1 Tax=Sporosarcina sp. FSL K6-1508 TaxID=2921553 RepID=UPI0030F725F0
MITINTELGLAIKGVRNDKGLTLSDLSELSGISKPYLSQIESGKRQPSTEILKKLAIALEIHYFDLLRLAGHNELVELYNAKQSKYNSLNAGESTAMNQLKSRLNAFEQATDLKQLLEHTLLTLKVENIKPYYNGHLLTKRDCERILAMLDILLPQYQSLGDDFKV